MRIGVEAFPSLTARKQMRLTLAQLLIDSFPTTSKLSGQYSWRRFVGDFPKLLLLQFFLGLVPELILPTFGLSGLLPQLMGAGSYLIVCWVRHNGASIGKHGPSQPGRGFRSAKAVPGRAYSSQPINQCELLMDVPAGTNRI